VKDLYVTKDFYLKWLSLKLYILRRLKTGVMLLRIQLCHHKNTFILKYNTLQLFLISFNCIFDQCNLSFNLTPNFRMAV